MASDVMSLFNMPTQEQLGQQYLEGMLTTPQQLGAQGLLQQVVSLGGNAGSMLGYGVRRMMGGMTADEVRAKGIDDAMRTVQGLGLTSDAEMYGALAQELANRGLTQDALKARNAGLEAKKAEETMRINQARLGIAQEELKLDKMKKLELLLKHLWKLNALLLIIKSLRILLNLLSNNMLKHLQKLWQCVRMVKLLLLIWKEQLVKQMGLREK